VTGSDGDIWYAAVTSGGTEENRNLLSRYYISQSRFRPEILELKAAFGDFRYW